MHPLLNTDEQSNSDMRIIDSHCHLDDKSYQNDLQEVVARAEAADVVRAMVVGVSEASSRRCAALADNSDFFYASVGIHPHDAADTDEGVLTRLAELAKGDRVKAWGECGLDFNRMYSPKDVQETWFVRQLEVAQSLDLPLIFHERDTEGRFLEMLSAHRFDGLRGVVHCFSGSTQEMEAYLDMGLHIGVTGIVTIQKRGEHLREQVLAIPRERLLVETDAPYLTPAPHKNKVRRNEPAFVREVLFKLAAVRGDDVELLADTVWNNTTALFDLS
ncbi:metal-dependent hydrolase [Desulfoluna butyratoxydans]|uniref:Metal-dependent hydrolase n=2 Tax=Desulfoluna butyratoxydans TaxID=231438 RepID=A0A4U8YJ42_9BACT|nr:metal-dependent hydrolase [Desulfoluna butyratoxydans]